MLRIRPAHGLLREVIVRGANGPCQIRQIRTKRLKNRPEIFVRGAKLVAVSTWSWPACPGHLDNRRALWLLL
jgi:hypothetical protein